MGRTLSALELATLGELGASLRASAPDISAPAFAGRGIVIVAGGSAVFTNAYVLIEVLRHTLGCTLPIEVWHFGPAEMSPAMAALLTELDVRLVDAEPVIRRHGGTVRDGWQLKPFAMLWSSFAEVLLLDADQVPTDDPAKCFEWPQYAATGAVFWPDIVDLLESNQVWTALGLPPRRMRSMESGQVLVDKRRHLRALATTVRLNEAADLLYRVIYGDKDTFLLGWELAKADFAMVPSGPFRDERVLIQRDFAGVPLFQHRTGAKWQYGGNQYTVENFVHEAACLAALASLERRWGGHIFHAPDRVAAARACEAELAVAGPMLFEAGINERFALELLPHGEIGAGRALDRRNWWCEERTGEMVLNLGRPEGITYQLTRQADGNWSGIRRRLPEVQVTLARQQPLHFDADNSPGLVEELVRAARFGRPDAEIAQLATALQLLARVEPGVVSRLRRLAGRAPTAEAASWGELLARVEPAVASQRVDISPASGLLRTGYAPSSFADETD